MKERELYRQLTTLGAKWRDVEKDIPLRDYAGNEFWDEVSDLDIILEFLPENHKWRKILEKARRILKRKGVAQYLGNCRLYGDHLTPLAILGGYITERKFEE